MTQAANSNTVSSSVRISPWREKQGEGREGEGDGGRKREREREGAWINIERG